MSPRFSESVAIAAKSSTKPRKKPRQQRSRETVEAILVALAERHIDDAFELIGGLLSKPGTTDPEALLRRFIDAMMTHHEDRPRLHRVLFEEAPLPVHLRRSLQRRENALAADVARVLGKLPGIDLRDPDLTAYILVRSIEGLVHGFILNPPPEIKADAFSDELVILLGRYLG